MGRILTLFLLLLACSCFSPQARSLDSRRDLAQYSHRSWLKRDGLPQNSVISLAQGADGFLWVGTYEGLARFDGSSFTIFNRFTTPALNGKFIVSMCATADTTLWIGVGGGGLVRQKRGVFERVPLPGDAGPVGVGPIFQDARRQVWASTTLGLVCFAGDSLLKIYTTADGLPQNYVTGIAEGTGGIAVAAGGQILSLQGGCFIPLPLKNKPEDRARLLVTDGRGGFWIGMWNGSVVHAGVESARRFAAAEGLPQAPIASLLADSDGSVWAGTFGGGLVRLDGGSGRVAPGDAAMSGDDVFSLLEDREGNLWVGAGTGGLNRFSQSKFTTYVAGPSAPQNFFYGMCEDRRGTVYAGTASRDLFRLEKGRFVADTLFRAVVPGIIMAFLEDRRGDLWFGTSAGVYRRHGLRYERSLYSSASALVEDSYGRIWAGTSKGLFLRQGTRWTECAGLLGGVVPDVEYMSVGSRLWVGTRNLGLVGLRVPPPPALPGKETPVDTVWYCRGKGLRSNWITYVREDSAGRLWVTTFGGGLSVIEAGTVRNIALAGTGEDGFFTALDDRCGYLWMSSNSGVYRVKVADVLRYAETVFREGSADISGGMAVPSTQFGLGAGMASDECNGSYQSSGFVGRNGRLWFPTTSGGVMVAPDSLPTNAVPPAVVIERARIDRQDMLRASGIPSSYGDREFEFGYTGISLAAPELVQFRVMLEGYDKSWVDVGERKICSYTNLSPGKYTFRVQARNADGVWNLTGAGFPFEVSPRFYQTWWFIILCGTCVMTAGAGLHSVYRRDRDRQLISAQLESRLAQAQLKVLEMQVQPHFLFNTLNGISVLIRDDPEKATRMITRLSDFVRLALDRSGVQEVPLGEELLFVEKYLQIELLRFADRLTVHEDVSDDLRGAFVPAMILQPIVENAIRHGISKRRGAVTIRIAAARDNGALLLHVSDNGAGLPASAVREGIGLTNTRERLRQLYGENQRLDLVNIATGGVDVALMLPFHTEPVRPWTESAH